MGKCGFCKGSGKHSDCHGTGNCTICNGEKIEKRPCPECSDSRKCYCGNYGKPGDCPFCKGTGILSDVVSSSEHARISKIINR